MEAAEITVNPFFLVQLHYGSVTSGGAVSVRLPAMKGITPYNIRAFFPARIRF